MSENPARPSAVDELESIYGAASQAGFGSAVFWLPVSPPEDLERLAREAYREFVGPLWERYGEAAWMEPWRRVHERPPGAADELVTALRGLEDADAARSTPLLLDAVDEPAKAAAALAAAFDTEACAPLAVYNVGDGQALSGLLVAGLYRKAGHALLLVMLMD